MTARLSPRTAALLKIYVPSTLMSFGMGVIVPAIPELSKAFGVSEGLAAQVVSAQAIGRTLSLIPTGLLIDYLGRKTAMTAGAAIVLAGALLASFTNSFWLLLLAQFAWGAGLSLYMVGREIAAADLVMAHQRGRFMSVLFGLQSAGVAFGPVIGGVITDLANFRFLFYIYAVMALITIIMARTITEPHRDGKRNSVSLLNFGKLKELDPAFRLTYLILMVVTLSAMMRTTLMNSMLPLEAGNLGYSAAAIGTIFGVMGVVSLLTMYPGGAISDRFGRKVATVPPAFISALTFALLPLAHTYLHLVLLAGVMGIANGMALGSLTTYTYDITPEGAKGRFQAQRRLVGEFGGFVAPVSAGALVAVVSPGITFLVFAPIHLIAGLAVLLFARESLARKRPQSAT